MGDVKLLKSVKSETAELFHPGGYLPLQKVNCVKTETEEERSYLRIGIWSKAIANVV